MNKLIVLTMLASLSFALAGCDATTRSAPGNTTLGSAAVGGLAGAGIGGLTGGTKGALVGTAIGATGGALLGSAAERNRDQQQIQQMQVQGAYQQGAADAMYAPPRPPAAYGPGPRSY